MKNNNESDIALAYLKNLLQKIYRLKYFYLVTFLILGSAAFLLNRYSPKVYKINSIIGPVKDSRSAALASNQMFSGSYGSSYSSRDLEAVINGLNSFTLISSTVNKLNLEIGYFIKTQNPIKPYSEIYLQSPVIVTLDKSHIQPINGRFTLVFLNDSTFRLTASETDVSLYNYIDNEIIAKNQFLEVDTIFKFNQTIDSWNFKFSVSIRQDLPGRTFDKKAVYSFEFYHPEQLAKYYLDNIKIEPVSWMASIINVQFSSDNLSKSLTFLNTFVNAFLEDNLDKKNRLATSTIKFIDSQISGMSDSLASSESTLRSFMSNNQAINLGLEGQRIYNQLTSIENEKKTIEDQRRYYNYVMDFFKTNQDISGITLPSTASISDPFLNNIFSELFRLNSERSALANRNERNVFSAELDSKIKVQKQALIDNITNNLNNLDLTLNELNYEADKLSKELSKLPGKELNMVNVQRKFDIDNTVYTYLLQKRSESAIALSSNYPDYEVLEPAREITAEKIKPKTLIIYAIAIFLAILLPTLHILIKDFFNNKITSNYEVEQIANRAIFCTIIKNTKNYEDIVMRSPGSAIAESFRNLRGSLLFKLNSHESKIILITSSQPQDGKSFISLNLASSIANVGFKTVVVDCDLRRPVLHSKFKKENSSGVSNFMIRQTGLDEIINKTDIPNLDFIMAGPILPNPSELISSGSLDDFIKGLKSRYDFIILDTAPIGLVSDSIQLMKYVSQVLLIIRENYTRKELLQNAIDSLYNKNIEEFELVLNDLNLDNSPYSEYKKYYHKE